MRGEKERREREKERREKEGNEGRKDRSITKFLELIDLLVVGREMSGRACGSEGSWQ